MKNKIKRIIGNAAIKLGEQSVGKCMIPGMFDPEIPQMLRVEMKENIGMENTCNTTK